MALRRQTYFLPTQISNCSLWLDAADTSSDSMILSGSNITTWKDKSGTGNNATANTGTVTTNSTTINGLNTIRFNTSSFLNIASFTMTANISVFAVLRGVTAQETGPKGYFFLGNGAQPSFFVYTLPPANGNLAGPFSGWVATTGETNWYMPSSDFFLNNPGFIYTDNNSSFVNGSQLTFNPNRASVPNAVSAGAYGIQVGGRVQADSLAFDFAECIFYNRTITAAQRQQVEGYLAQKWGLTASLPADHPGLTSILYRVQRPFFTKTPYFAVFSPRQISGLGLWLDGADPAGNGIIPASGATVSTWVDKSGNANNGTSGSATFQTDSAGGFINFTGSQTYAITNPNIVVNQYFTIFVVEQLQNYAGGEAAFMGGNGSFNANLHMRYVTGGGGIKFGFFGNDLDASVTAFLTNATQPIRIWSFSFTASSRVIYLNGTSIGSDGNNTQISAWGGANIGAMVSYGGQYYNGKMREVMIYSGTMTTTPRQQVESYLAQKWNLTLSLPAAHLNATFPAGSPTAIQPFISRIRPALTSIPFVGGGGTTSSSGSFTIRTFTTTSQLILSKAISATILVVGGGGGGGSAGVQTGGGGAGGAVFVSSPVTITAGTYAVTVGTGGGINTNGTNSTFLSYTGIGGGGGGNWINGAGKTGGCGGGGSGEGGSGAAGSQGFGGANGRGQFTCGGGGGGMGQAGKQPADGSPSSGGNGLQYSITGTSVYYAGGGAGGFNSPSTGGLGGGGDKTVQGTDGLGGGGGSGARGGNGVVIISFVFI